MAIAVNPEVSGGGSGGAAAALAAAGGLTPYAIYIASDAFNKVPQFAPDAFTLRPIGGVGSKVLSEFYAEQAAAQLNVGGLYSVDGRLVAGTTAEAFVPLAPTVHPRYFTALYAGNQLADDPMVYDISGAGGHAVPGAALPLATLWGTAGYASTTNPPSDTTVTRLVMPVLNFDYDGPNHDGVGAESLFIWWLGKATAEVATTVLMGDTFTSASVGGMRIIVVASQVGGFSLYDQAGTSYNSSSVTGPIFDGNLHSFGVYIDGPTRKYSWWTDEVQKYNRAPLSSGAAIDTRSSQYLHLGGNASATQSAGSGFATATRALHIIRFAGGDPKPTDDAIQAAVLRLRQNPGRLIQFGDL